MIIKSWEQMLRTHFLSMTSPFTLFLLLSVELRTETFYTIYCCLDASETDYSCSSCYLPFLWSLFLHKETSTSVYRIAYLLSSLIIRKEEPKLLLSIYLPFQLHLQLFFLHSIMILTLPYSQHKAHICKFDYS